MKKLFLIVLLVGLNVGIGLALSYGGEDSKTKPAGDIWKDPTSGLTWQVKPPGAMHWAAAKLYCRGLSLSGHNDWRLPTISELRTLVRGCAPAQKGGSCGVKDSCLKQTCWNDDPCRACAEKGGSGPGGAYWPPELSGKAGWYWSSSPVADLDGLAWSVGFDYGVIFYSHGNVDYEVRCVR